MERLPSDEGMLLLNELLLRMSCCNLERLPSSVGMLPLNELFLM